MSKNVAMFVDVANLYYAARGQDVDVDYVALLKHATKGRDLIRAYAYSGLDPENENQRKFLDFLNKNGYKVVHKDIRKFGDGRVKANLDIELVVDMLRLGDRMDIAVVVSGDGDFASAIRALQDRGVRCEVISFRPNTSSDLIAVADEFIDIMKVASIERGKASKMMGAPEMPAKEVNPEFGFREASRTVAAAAIAALRTGGAPARGRGRGRGTSAPSASSVQEAPTVAPTPSNGSNGDVMAIDGDGSRRRRRRRGGRGRGRRTGEETVSTEMGGGEMGDPNTEVGWEEFDDISQLGVSAETDEAELDEPQAGADTDAEAAEIGFEEVDAATLAELGISPAEQEQPSAAADAGASRPRARAPRARTTTRGRAADTATESGEAATPRRTRGTRATKATTTPASDATAEEKPKRATRSRTPKATAEAGTEEKPKRATRGRAPKSADASTGEDGEGAPEGIWQRFRSGRTSS